MKKVLNATASMLSTMAKKEVNAASVYIIYQPEPPKNK